MTDATRAQRLVNFARNHGFRSWLIFDGKYGASVAIPWTRPATEPLERGEFIETARNLRDMLNILGY